MGWQAVYVVAVALATVALWCANGALAPYLGQMGIVAILPMVAFFGFGILSKVRLRSLHPLRVCGATQVVRVHCGWAVTFLCHGVGNEKLSAVVVAACALEESPDGPAYQ